MTAQSPTVADKPSFKDLQYRFTAHIRDPKNNPAPEDIEDRRLNIYRELFYNNIEGFVSSSFPVLRSLYKDDDWHAMVRDFFIRHECHTPYFLEIAQEFIDYLQNERDQHASDFPFMLELAHYEWVELALEIDENEIDMQGIDSDGDLLAGHPVISPLAWPLSYSYEVHKISADNIPDAPITAHLVVYRNRDDAVRFMEINAVTARLLQLLSENETLSGREALQQVATELQHPSPDTVIDSGLSTLRELKDRDIVLGTTDN